MGRGVSIYKGQVFDLEEGRRQRDLALSRVQLNKEDWIKKAKQAVWLVAGDHTEFTTDDVWATGLPHPDGDARALGPVMLKAQKANVIQPTERFRPSRIVAYHAAPKRIWKSLR